MAISRVPGFSLLANLDRQGTDVFISSNGQTLFYWDVNNYRVGINQSTPQQALDVNGNILVANGHVYTGANVQFDLGSHTNQWRNFYGANVYATLAVPLQPFITSLGNLTALNVDGQTVLSNVFVNSGSTISVGNNRITYVATPTVATDAATKGYVDSVLSGSTGNTIVLGTPTDGNLTSPGAWGGWTTGTYVTDAIDDLNEMMENVRANTFVKSVTFTGSPLAGGAGTTVTLTIVPTGSSNRYDIAWGDGTYSNASVSTSPTHTYSDNTNSPFDVTVRAYNTAGSGTGSEASFQRIDYIIIYTADPVVSFELYRAASGGSALTGNNLYVIEGNTVYVKNNTTNTTMATVAYQMNFGDGTANVAIANDSADGGVLGNRLSYTPSYTVSSGTGTNTLRLFLTSHTTANPSVIPTAGSLNLKVYDANIAPPAGLNTKTLSLSSVGTSPFLAASFVDNTGGTTLSAGQAVTRTVTTGTTLITTSGNVTTNYSYTANVGYLQAVVNGTVRGNVDLSATTTAGITGNLGVVAFSDFWLLTSAGASTTFASSTYYPGEYWGFTANLVAQGGSIPVGVNRFGLNHTTTGIVANVELVKDDVTTVPTVTAGNIAIRNPGTYRYVSGIPYFNTGSPTLWLQDVTINSFIGQTYTNSTNIAFVAMTNTLESTSGNIILANAHPYTALSNSSATMLSGSTPIAGTGNVSAYKIANLIVAINPTSTIRSVGNIGLVVNNVNGASASTPVLTKRIQVHTAAQAGISEISVNVSASLGNGAITSAGIRSTYFLSSTTNTPTYVGATNFYTSNIYSESSDPGVAGTKEATLRLGTIKHDLTDYSSVFLPPGPNRSGDTGGQYFTFAFRRYVVANFDINITSSTGVVGVWIAAPGTTIDSTSGLNGWLDCSTAYAGAGVPGSNTGAGGNGSDGCASTTGDRIQANVALSGGYTMTLGTENMTNATNQVVLVRIALASGQAITALSVGVAA